jgi:acyl dehydratase
MKKITIQITNELINQFAEISLDKNLIHMDDFFASKTPFKKRIAHGLIVLAGISRILTEELGDGNVLISENIQYLKPAYLGDIISINIEKNKKDNRGLNKMLVVAINQKNEKILKCEALCKNIYTSNGK